MEVISWSGAMLAARVFADVRDVGPIHVTVEAQPDPAATSDIWRSEEAPRILGNECLLRTVRRRAPRVREAIVMVAVGSAHHELLAAEERRRSVAEPLSHLGEGHADATHPVLDLGAVHGQQYGSTDVVDGSTGVQSLRGSRRRSSGGPL